MLEYYEGILFLTTNRLNTMDIAFKSRIHIAVKYKDLTPALRRQIWLNFINLLGPAEAEGKDDLLDHIDDIQEWELNGREIRNVLSIAQSLALGKSRRPGALRYRDVEQVAIQTLNFQSYFMDIDIEKSSRLRDAADRRFQERTVRKNF
jgi:hypothetical protein